MQERGRGEMKKLIVPVMTGVMMFGGFAGTANASQFKDVQKGSYYEVPVNFLYKQKVTSGVGADKFGVGHELSRETAVTLLMKGLGYKEGEAEYSPPAGFKDVDKNSYHYNFINMAHNLGIVSGVDNGNFAPKKTMTRAEMAVMIDKAYELEAYGEEGTSPFVDLNEASWAKDYINRLSREGITGGTSASTFSPNQKITREQFATFLYNAEKNEVEYMPRIVWTVMTMKAVHVDFEVPAKVNEKELKFTLMKDGKVVAARPVMEVTSNGLSKKVLVGLFADDSMFAPGTYELKIDGIDLDGENVIEFTLE
jgi:S-layer homology domain